MICLIPYLFINHYSFEMFLCHEKYGMHRILEELVSYNNIFSRHFFHFITLCALTVLQRQKLLV